MPLVRSFSNLGTTKMWFWFNVFVTAPAVIAAIVYTVPDEIAHINHLKEHPKEWVPHPYLRKHKNVAT